MEGAGISHFSTPTDIPESSSCICSSENPTFCTCRSQPQQNTQTQQPQVPNVITEQIDVAQETRSDRPQNVVTEQVDVAQETPSDRPQNVVTEQVDVAQETPSDRPQISGRRRIQSAPRRYIANPNQLQEGETLVSRYRLRRNGLSEEAIHARMERHVFSNNGSAQDVGPCSVCYEDFCDNDETGKLNCGHQFHYDCIKNWLKEMNSCPLCKMIALEPPEP